jgi:hypothetical protein
MYENYDENYLSNKDIKFIHVYNNMDWTNKFQIGRLRRKITLNDISEDKLRIKNVLDEIYNNDNFEKINHTIQELIVVVESRLKHPPLMKIIITVKCGVFYSE